MAEGTETPEQESRGGELTPCTPCRLVHLTTVPMSLRFLSGQIEYLRDRGYKVAAISSPGPELESFGDVHDIEVHGVEMQRRITPLRDLVAVLRILRLLKRLRPDLVHAHTPKAGLLGMIGAWVAGSEARIYQMRGLPHVEASGIRRMALWLAERVSCALAHRVICNSRSLRDVAVSKRLCPAGKIVVAGSGSGQGVDARDVFDPDRLPVSERQATCSRLGIPVDARVIGFVGRLVRDKGVVELERAWSTLREERPDLHLLVVGPFEERDAVPAPVRTRLEADGRVCLTGEDWNTPPLYAAMDVLALPTHREGFPNVLLEAAAMKLPVVSTRVPGCVDAVVDRKTGILVPSKDADALAVALREYLEDPALRRRHGRAARERVLRYFRPDRIFEEVEREYRRVTSTLQRKRTRRGRRAKRAFDAVVATMALVLFSPLIVLLALVVRIGMGGPILFRQERTGLGGERFTLYKFRTMRAPCPAESPAFSDEDRLTKLGRFLRSTSLDELPTLWNVVRGEMSLVGPRPLLPRYLPFYDQEQARRHEVRPGITGWAQINGRNAIDWSEKFRLDVWYVENRSFSLDLRILLVTLWKVLRREGISQEGRATVEFFDDWLLSRDVEQR